MTGPLTHGSWVMGQELSGSLGSWVTLSDPFPALGQTTGWIKMALGMEV